MKLIALFFLLHFAFAGKEDLTIYTFRIETGDSQLIVFPSGYSILIDCGEPGGTTGVNGHSAPYISDRIYNILGRKEIDVFVLSHFHWDHQGGVEIGGIWYLLEKAGFKIKKFIRRDVGSYSGSKLSHCDRDSFDWKYVGDLSDTEIEFVCYATSTYDKTKLSQVGEVSEICGTRQIQPPDFGAEVKIIISDAIGLTGSDGKKMSRNSMSETYPVSENDFCICLRITFGNFVYATCGDLSGYPITFGEDIFVYNDVESSVAPMIGEVDLAHLNHHGSYTSTNPTWANTLKPTVGIASRGADVDRLQDSVLKNLSPHNTKIYQTGKKDGTSGELFKNVIYMNDDVVVTVPVNSDTFTVSNSQGGNSAVYQIKQNKAAPTQCVVLG